jgi:hypothetical protein
VHVLAENRMIVAAFLALGLGEMLRQAYPFPAGDPLLQFVLENRPGVFGLLRWTWMAMLFSTPFLLASSALGAGYIFAPRSKRAGSGVLPAFPSIAGRTRLEVVVGEVHHERQPGPAPEPRWLAIPDRGLFTGTAVFGAIGSGKTSCCMYPFAEQVLAYRADDVSLRPAGLVLEVKGDFCAHVSAILEQHGRGDDYCEITIGGKFRYNPLHNDLEAYALAYGIASTMNNLFGRGKEPFWQQAYTNLIKFVILLHKVLFDYCTLWDLYVSVINPDRIESLLREGEGRFHREFLLVDPQDYVDHAELAGLGFEFDKDTEQMRGPASDESRAVLAAVGVSYEVMSEVGGEAAGSDRKREQFEAVRRWFYHDWRRIEPKLRTSVVEGISVFLSLFDDDPSVRYTFCPEKECYDPEKNTDGKHGIPLPSFTGLIESGKVVALNFPAAANPGLARAIGTMLKQDFQRAMLMRIPRLAAEPAAEHRSVLFLCDEYQAFATVGESDPSGDEKFFALSRQARCIPLISTQSISSLRSTLPGESWRTLLQTFRTKIFLTLTDDVSAKIASDLCGRTEQMKESYALSESGQDAGVSVLTGRAVAHRASVSTSKTYSAQMHPVFEPRVFTRLRNAEAIILAYDGFRPLPAQYIYMKPHHLDRNVGYFEQEAKGLL